MFTMEELTAKLKEVEGDRADITMANREVYMEVNGYDWFWQSWVSGWGITVVLGYEIDIILLGDRARVFKPRQAMDVYFALVNQDGTPLSNIRRQVTLNVLVTSAGVSRNEEVKVLAGDDGIVEYRYVPQDDDQFINIVAHYDDVTSRTADLVATRFYTPSNSFIYITTSTADPHIDRYMIFTVTTNTFVQTIHYVVTAGGNIITGGEFQMTSRQKTFSLSLSRDMIPQAHIVVWHVLKGEVIADSLNFFVNGTRVNEVDLQFNRGKDFSGDTVEVTARTDESGYVGSIAIDYELWAHGCDSFITETDIIQELSTFDSNANSSFTHMWNGPDEQEYLVSYPAPSYGWDANTTFEYAGLIVFTDSNLTRIPHFCNETMGYFPCMDASCYTLEQWCDGVSQCKDGVDEMGCPKTQVERFTKPIDRLALQTRHFYQTGDWLWGGHFVMPNGRIDVITTVPIEQMTWMLSGFGISRDKGFGVVHTPARFESTRSVFMRAEAPASVVKGEQIGVRMALFNFYIEDIEAVVTLHDSPNYKFVVVEDFGIVSSYNPRTIRGNIQIMVYLVKGSTHEIQIPILPVVDGCFDISLTMTTVLYNDVEILEMCTKYDGVTNYLHTPYFVDLINSGSMVLPDLEIPVDEQFVQPEKREHLYVPGSPVAKVGISGDVIGPGFFEDFLNTQNTLHKPYGSAESSMYNYAYNLYNLKYLKDSNQLEDETLIRTLHYLSLALQRQLGYMNSDYSFSQFRDYQTYTPSTWVTAFVLRTLQASSEADWESKDFFIDVDLLNKITQWLCTQQAPNGKFQEQAPIYDRKMRSNWTYDEEAGEYTYPNLALTSYVLISLSEAKSITGAGKICADAAKNLAVGYLEKWVEKIEDPYTMAITSYALTTAGSSKRTDAYYRLDSMKYTDNNIYWANKPVPPNDIKMIDTLPYHQPRRWYDNEGYAVETTAWALQVYLIQQQESIQLNAKPIMEWLQLMRNTIAGQASTADTITALIALTKYAEMDTNRDLYNILFNVQATSMGNFSEDVHLTKANWPNLTQVNIDPVWGSVRGTVRGTGVALMQLQTWVNVEYPNQILPAAEDYFFDVRIQNQFSGRNFSIMHSTICARWARPDISNTSGLTVLEVDLPTGYVVTGDVLRAYAQSGIVPLLRRSDNDFDRKVTFYFDYLPSDTETCVNFRTDRWYPVSNMTIQHKLRVYDYYEPGMHNTTLYTTYDLFNLHICQVCGSFQCPYCPFYNTATTLHLSLYVSLLMAVFVLIITRFTNQ